MTDTETDPPTTEFYAKITRSHPSFSVTVQSTPPAAGSMTVWELRDFIRALDAAGIPDDASLVAENNYDTKHFTGIRVQCTVNIDTSSSMNGVSRGRIRCRFQQPHGYDCDRPAVGTAYNRWAAADLPICLPCADRIDLPVTPYNGQMVTA